MRSAILACPSGDQGRNSCMSEWGLKQKTKIDFPIAVSDLTNQLVYFNALPEGEFFYLKERII
jgi:hypothetical protein